VQDISSKIKKSKSRHYIKSSSFIMALVFTILCGAAALSLGYFINYFTQGHFIETTEAALDAEIRYIEALGERDVLPKHTGKLYIYLDKNAPLPDYLSSSISRLAEGIIVFNYPKNNHRYAAKIYTSKNAQRILVGTDITSISKKFKFMQWLGVAAICFVMLIVFAAYVISVFVVTETNKIADTARDIMNTGDLSRRLEVGSKWDDLGNMTIVLNALLARVEELMTDVRQVSDNIAHDLRTPLTRMRSNIETLPESKNKDELLDEADHILNTFNALLRISRIEAEQQKSQFAPINLKNLLDDVAEFYAPLAEEKNINLTAILSDISLNGDRDLLFQAYANLLDNAIKFSPNGGTVKLTLTQKHNDTLITVQDSGVGIADNEKNKIFNRFYRGVKCRSTHGTGLGLSLVSAVIKLHGGTITVKDNNPGLKIITIL